MARFSPVKLNISLALAVVILSLLTISWHHQTYVLYRQARTVAADYQQLNALNTQLKIEQSQQNSGIEIERKARLELEMHAPSKIRYLAL